MCSTEPLVIGVEGERFQVSLRSAATGTYDVVWLSGPNPGYGFTSRTSTGRWSLTRVHLEDAVKAFLSEIDPGTGFLAD